MKSFTRGNFRAAATSLRQNKGRSFLTMLGIIIGVSSVITVVSIGDGIKHQITANLNHAGKNLITVRPGHISSGGLGSIGSLANVTSGGSLTSKDFDAIQTLKGVGSVASVGVVAGTVRGDNGIYEDGPVIMTNQDFPRIINQSVAFGVFLTQEDDDNYVAVLGAHAASQLFNTNVPLGQTFSFRGKDFMVRGIMNDTATAPLSSDVNFNNAIFITTDAGKKLTNGSAGLYEILAKPTGKDARSTAAAIQDRLTRLHGDSHDFSVLQGSQAQAQTDNVLSLLTELITGVAAVSLLVGGIGIMNIMLVSVTERMHEVGIRKAIGATNRQIMSEFMAEATVLSIVGSIIGIIVALAVNVLLRVMTSLTPTFDWRIIVLASFVSIAVGLLFGTAPAMKAARKDPIAALRGE